MGPFGRGDKNPWLYEPIAGMVDLGEAPIETARREAQEEAGLEISRLIPMFDGYPSPGGSTTYFHFFLGECDLSNLDQGTGGLKDEGEDIRVHVIPFSDAFDMVMRGACRVMPLITAILWLAQYRNRDLVS
jgi:nudix-type nucleoside diphosphatase (YffH/AdpP family)